MKIAHISDVHIFNHKRHSEYRELFESLYLKLNENKPERVILLGDLVNNKNILSPETVVLLHDLIQNLSYIADVDLIVGNHDSSLANKNRLNSIYAVYHSLKYNKKIHYYEKSGLYKISEDTYYGIFSLLDSREDWPIHIENKKDNVTYIALYHGTISGSKTYSLPIQSDVGIGIFQEYDMALYGDIHKRQFLDAKIIEKKIDVSEMDKYKHELSFKVVA